MKAPIFPEKTKGGSVTSTQRAFVMGMAQRWPRASDTLASRNAGSQGPGPAQNSAPLFLFNSTPVGFGLVPTCGLCLTHTLWHPCIH